MCVQEDDVIQHQIKVMKKELEYLYDREQSIQEEKVQFLSQKLDRLINVMLKRAIKQKKG